MSHKELLDLSGVPCPANSARALLKLEMLGSGEELEVLLDDGEPAKNVPAAMAEAGHELLSRSRTGSGWVMVFRKAS
jgi:TusA-related sulfurtransferase